MADNRTSGKFFASAGFIIAYIGAALALAMGVLLFFASPETDSENTLYLLWANLGLCAMLLLYLGSRVWTSLSSGSGRRQAGRLQVRFVTWFSLAAIIPALIVWAFLAMFLQRDFNDWFSANISTAMAESKAVAQAYINREVDYVRSQISAIAQDLNREVDMLDNRISYANYLTGQAVFRDLASIYVLADDGRILARAESPNAPPFQPPTPLAVSNAKQGKASFASQDDLDFMRALIQLNEYGEPPVFLYAGRFVESGILGHLYRIAQVDTAYTLAGQNRSRLRRTFILTYLELAILLLIGAISLAQFVANRVTAPLSRLVETADTVRSGDLTARAPVSERSGEIRTLADTFNSMLSQLDTQRRELVDAHAQSERRLQFSQTVLSGVSAGVIGLDRQGRIQAINRSAQEVLSGDKDSVTGMALGDVAPELQTFLDGTDDSLESTREGQIELAAPSGLIILHVRVSDRKSGKDGWVITFDDVSRLVAAQRQSAWREVARRIAHEIKNPLTPIQLSAERLRRKYLKEIKSDPETFTRCTDTIIRQVSDLQGIVDEFSQLSRISKPAFTIKNISELIEITIFSQHLAFPDIDFDFSNQIEGDTAILCEERLFLQALTNLTKNAAESVMSRTDQDGVDPPDGHVQFSLEDAGEFFRVDLEDNGLGWPFPDTERLLEPYVTTRSSGTGLGLAIVSRIIGDHQGKLELLPPAHFTSGARVRLEIPKLVGSTGG